MVKGKVRSRNRRLHPRLADDVPKAWRLRSTHARTGGMAWQGIMATGMRSGSILTRADGVVRAQESPVTSAARSLDSGHSRRATWKNRQGIDHAIRKLARRTARTDTGRHARMGIWPPRCGRMGGDLQYTIPREVPAYDYTTGGEFYAPPVPYGHYAKDYRGEAPRVGNGSRVSQGPLGQDGRTVSQLRRWLRRLWAGWLWTWFGRRLRPRAQLRWRPGAGGNGCGFCSGRGLFHHGDGGFGAGCGTTVSRIAGLGGVCSSGSGWATRSILLPAMPRPWRRPARFNRSDRPPFRPLASRSAAIRAARSGAVIRTWATSDAGSAADRDAAVAAERALVIRARFAAAWAMAIPVRSVGLAAAAVSSSTASGTAGRDVHSAAARAVRAACTGWGRRLTERSII